MASEHHMSVAVRLLAIICSLLVADVCATDPNGSRPEGEPPSQASSVATAQHVAVSSSATPVTATDVSAGGKPNPPASEKATATSPINANNSKQKVLVDDTVSDAQLRGILAKGYRPDRQAPGNEVYYCRNEQLSGERFQTKVCKTAARILEDESRGRELINSVERIGLQTGR
jgi:hypothetical protein